MENIADDFIQKYRVFTKDNKIFLLDDARYEVMTYDGYFRVYQTYEKTERGWFGRKRIIKERVLYMMIPDHNLLRVDRGDL